MECIRKCIDRGPCMDEYTAAHYYALKMLFKRGLFDNHCISLHIHKTDEHEAWVESQMNGLIREICRCVQITAELINPPNLIPLPTNGSQQQVLLENLCHQWSAQCVDSTHSPTPPSPLLCCTVHVYVYAYVYRVGAGPGHHAPLLPREAYRTPRAPWLCWPSRSRACGPGAPVCARTDARPCVWRASRRDGGAWGRVGPVTTLDSNGYQTDQNRKDRPDRLGELARWVPRFNAVRLFQSTNIREIIWWMMLGS